MAVSLDVYPGNVLPLTLDLDQEDGSAFDLTGYTVTVFARYQNCEMDEMASPDVEDDEGTIDGSFTGTQTQNWPLGRKTKIFVRLTDSDGYKDYLVARVRMLRYE